MDEQADKIITDIIEERTRRSVLEFIKRPAHHKYTGEEQANFTKDVDRLAGIYQCDQGDVMRRLGIWK
jgi:hypothetical protein